MESAKRILELTVLDIAKELLEKLYGKFEINSLQVDRPDAEIKVIRPKKSKFGREPFNVGIEITTVDPREYLAYFNDRKHGQEVVSEKMADAMASRENIGQSNKYMATPIPEDYIFSGAMKKAVAYESYSAGGKYREMVLLCFSELVQVDNEIFRDGLRQWTEYKLSEAAFPYDAVLFIDLRSRRAARVYDKKSPQRNAPPPYEFADANVERIETFLLAGQMGEYASKSPLITPKKANS